MKPAVFFNEKKYKKAREINNVSYINFWNNKYSCDLFLPELCQFFARKLGSFICLFVCLFIYLFIYLFIILGGRGRGWVATKATIKMFLEIIAPKL